MDSNSNSVDTCFSKSSKSSEVESTPSSGYETLITEDCAIEENQKDASENIENERDSELPESFTENKSEMKSEDTGIEEKDSGEQTEMTDNCSSQEIEVKFS